jgi:hypothetical protein
MLSARVLATLSVVIAYSAGPALFGGACACAGRHGRPTLPPPEYEEPPHMAPEGGLD